MIQCVVSPDAHHEVRRVIGQIRNLPDDLRGPGPVARQERRAASSRQPGAQLLKDRWAARNVAGVVEVESPNRTTWIVGLLLPSEAGFRSGGEPKFQSPSNRTPVCRNVRDFLQDPPPLVICFQVVFVQHLI